jgi:hypothetical protein
MERVNHQKVIQIKKEAKEMKKVLRCNYSVALNLKAERLGYENWTELVTKNNLSRSSKNKVI